jgi:hypothetical protein
MKDGVGAVGVEVDLDPRLDEMRPQRAWWDLQFQRPVGHAIVVLDLALLLNAQDLVEIDARNRREGRAGLGGGHGEAGVVDGQVDLADKGVGRLDRDDPREPELLRQPVLERPERPLRAPSRLGRRETPVSRRAMPRMSPDMLDAELPERAAHLREMAAVDLAALFGGYGNSVRRKLSVLANALLKANRRWAPKHP